MINSKRLPEPQVSTEAIKVDQNKFMPTPILENLHPNTMIASPSIYLSSQSNYQIKSISPTIPDFLNENQNLSYQSNLQTPKLQKSSIFTASPSNYTPIFQNLAIDRHVIQSISPPNVSKNSNSNLIEIQATQSPYSASNQCQIEPNQTITNFPQKSRNSKKSNIKLSQNKENSDSEEESEIPKAAFYNKDGLKYGVRCVCNNPSDEGFLVQCEKCEMWLHAGCVNYTRNIKGVPFYCPFCSNTKIKCVCGKNMQYDLQLIKCQKCGNYSHKRCEDIEHGKIPDNFICTECRKLDNIGKAVYEIPFVKFTEEETFVADFNIFTSFSPQRSESNESEHHFDSLKILSSLPDGLFKNMIIEDLNNSELSFRPFLEKYFHAFAPLLFQGVHEFFKVFIETITNIFNVESEVVLDGLDALATHLLYDIPCQKKIKSSPKDEFANSESLDEYFSNLQVPRLEELPPRAEICIGKPNLKETKPNQEIKPKKRGRKSTQKNIQTINNAERIENKHGVYTLQSLDEGSFITEIPGFLLYTEEIESDQGIPLTSLLITNDFIMIDTEGTSFEPISIKIRRGFHFNCIVKLVRIEGQIKAALFATKLKGPLNNDKIKRGEAIPANSELILPFDGDIPYLTEKIEWKERKHKKNIATIENEKKEVHKKKRITQQVVAKKLFVSPELSLLSAFQQDSVPPIPFILVSDEEDAKIYRTQMEKLKYRNLFQ